MRYLLLSTALLISHWRLTAADATPASRPNVIVLLTDDQGLGDTSFMGNPVLKTPNMDRLARESVRFTDFHVAPMCSPTRGQLMTGVDALRNKVTSVTAGRTFLRPGLPTAPELFAKAGYKTGLFGKWHLGDHNPHRPMDKGFQEANYHLGWGMRDSIQEFDNPLFDGQYFHNGVRKMFAGHCTDLWFDRATDWIKERKEKGEPFFCYLPTNAPHAPCLDKDEFVAPYKGKGPAGFFGMIAHIDERLGRLEDYLKESGLRENTIVVFMTDNGGTAGVPVFNAGLRDKKTSYYDGGHRVPCWVRWPAGEFGAARDIAMPTQVQDVLPTLLDLCGVPIPGGTKFDGLSLAGVIRGHQAATPDRSFVVQYGQVPKKWDACVVGGNWRLVKGEELYDVVADRGQKENVAAKHPDVLKTLRDHYEQWWAGVEDQLNDFVPTAHLGTDKEPLVALNSGDWENIYADNTGHVRSAVGGPTGGRWHLFVENPGEYEVVLRRWPRESHAALGAKYDSPHAEDAAGKKKAAASKSFPIAAAVVEAAGKKTTAKTSPGEQEVLLSVNLPAGKTTMQAWFQDDKGNDLCGAFFAYVRKIN